MQGAASLRRFCFVAVAALLLGLPTAVRAQQIAGATLSPDFQSYMVNKDVGAERWTINLNLFSADPTSIISVTGNIFRADDGPASFVTCLVRSDSSGDLRDPDSTFRLSCSGAAACSTTAASCARTDWTLIADDVRVPASFFLPPGGNGGTTSAAVDSFIEAPQSAQAQGTGGRGATLTLDRLNHLVTKDVGSERWAISYSEQPFRSDQLGVDTRFLSVTGNVYQSNGTPPSFVYCTLRPDSTGTLADPASVLRFVCQGTDACETTARECAAKGWRPISSDVRLSASFFLPPLGEPAAPQSDPDIVVIGRTSDPPSLIAPGSEAAAASVAVDRIAGECPVDAACTVPRIGSCQDVPGTVIDDATLGCRCLVADVPSTCIRCGEGAAGQCGAACEFPVGDATARGVCLPYDAQAEACACYAIGAGEDLATQGCGGAIGLACQGDRCCANDPRGDCDPLGGEAPCPGVCVAAHGCDPDEQQCGICVSPPAAPTPTPVPTPTPDPTPVPTASPTPSPTPQPTPSPIPTPSPDPICLGAGEVCSPVRPPSCCSGLVCTLSPNAASVCVPSTN